MTDAPDFITPDEPPADLAAQIRELSKELIIKISAKAVLEEKVDALNAEIYELSAKTIPDKMMEARMDRIGLPEVGVDVRLKDWVRALLPKPDESGSTRARDTATAWLDSHGYGSLIKTEVSAVFDKTERNMALSAAGKLREEFPDKPVYVKEDVHHMTYSKWAKERLEAGEILPMELLGVSAGKVAEVVKRKEK